MPKLIDRIARADTVYPVVCAIVAKEGVAAASVRRIAVEAGLTPHALRHQWPTQERLHLRTVQWLKAHWADEWPWWTPGADPVVHVRKGAPRHGPLDEARRARAHAWLALSRAEHHDTVMGEVISLHNRHRALLVRNEIDFLRSAAVPKEGPGRVVTSDDMVPAEPDLLEHGALHLLIVVAGLTSLLSEHELPLGPDAAIAWLDRFTPGGIEPGETTTRLNT